MLILSILYIIFKGGSRFFQPAINHRLYGESNVIVPECRHTEGWEVTGDRKIQFHPCMLVQWADRQDFLMSWWSPHPWRCSRNVRMWHSVFWAGWKDDERGQRLEILEVFSNPNGPLICFILRVSVQPCNSTSTVRETIAIFLSLSVTIPVPWILHKYWWKYLQEKASQAFSASELKLQRCLQTCSVLLELNLGWIGRSYI